VTCLRCGRIVEREHQHGPVSKRCPNCKRQRKRDLDLLYYGRNTQARCDAQHKRYWDNPEKYRKKTRDNYAENSADIRADQRKEYWRDVELTRAARRAWYAQRKDD